MHFRNFRAAILSCLVFLFASLAAAGPALAADLQVSQYQWSPDPVANGADAVFSVRATNNGPTVVANAVVTIAVSDRFQVLNAPANFPAYCTLAGAIGSQTLTCALPALQAGIGNSQNFTYTARAIALGATDSTATIAAAGNSDSNASNDSLTVTPTVRAGADLTVALAGSAASVPAGAPLAYTLTARNLGPNPSTAIRVVHSLPASSDFQFLGASGSNWSCGAAGTTLTCNYTGGALAVPATLPAITVSGKVVKATTGTITSIASIQSTDSLVLDPVGSNDSSAAVVTTITAGTDLRAIKAMPATIIQGTAATITLSIRNDGPQAAPAGTTISDPIDPSLTIGAMPAGCSLSGTTATCTAGALAVNAQRDFLIPVTGTAVTPGTLTNTATLTPPAGFADADPATNSASAPFAVAPANADLQLLSKTKGPTPVAPGAAITSTIVVRNVGPSVASYAPGNPIRVTDTVSASETYVSAGAGWSCAQAGLTITCATTGTSTLAVGSTLTLSLVTQAATGTDTTIANQACTDTTAGSGHLPSAVTSPTGNDCQSASVRSTTMAADLRVLKDVSLSNSGGWTDALAIADTDTSFYVRLQVSNVAGDTARSVDVADVLPNSLNGGGFVTSVVQDSVTIGSMSWTPSSGRIGWTLTNLAPGATETLIFRVDRPFGSGSYTNTATVTSSDTTETDLSNNSDTAGYTVAPIADMTVTDKAIAPNPPRVGVGATYVISLRNAGANPADTVALTDTIDPARFEILGTPTTTKPGGSCSANAGTGLVSCALGQFASNEARQVSVQVLPRYPFGGNLFSAFPVSHTNRAAVTTVTRDSNGGTDPNAGNNFFDLIHQVNAPSFDIAVSNAETNPVTDDPVRFNETLNYDIRISNFGPSRATDITLTDLPAPAAGQTMTLSSVTINPVGANSGLTLQAAPNAACAPSGGNYVCKVDPTTAALNYLDPGKQVIFRLVFTMGGTLPTAPTTFAQTAQLTSAEHPVWNGTDADSQTANNRAVQTTTVLPSTDLEVVAKTLVGGLVRNIDEPLDYTIRIRDNGPSPTTQVRLSDVLPAGFVFVSATAPVLTVPAGSTVSPSGISCTGTTTIACVIDGTFPAGPAETLDITLQVRAAAPYAGVLAPTNAVNTVSIAPGQDAGGNPLSEDEVPGNNSKTANVQIQDASIAGTVYADNNRSDAIDAGEALAGVTVTLTGTDAYARPVNRTVQTDAGGAFLFDRLPPSDSAGYTLTETQPGTYFDRTETAGTLGGTVNNLGFGNGAAQNQIGGIVLPANAHATGYLFQEYREAQLSGFIYRDLNNDGTRLGAGETGYGPSDFAASPQVRLTGTDYAGTAVNLTATVNASGAYSFAGLAPSDAVNGYTVTELAQPSAASDGRDSNGAGVVIPASSGRPAPEDIVVGVVNPAASLTERNFGELPTSSLAGRVYYDPNANALRDSSENTGIATAVIRLTGSNDLGETIDCSLTTDATGAWSFPLASAADARCRSLRPGTYAVTETPPAGLVHTGVHIGSLGGTAGSTSGTNLAAPGAGNLAVTGIVVTAGSAGTGYDFGENGQGIAGSVYVDSNANGHRDSGEPGIAGVSVTLAGTTGSNQDVCGFIACVVTTDAAGTYRYLNVPGSNGAGYSITEQAQSAAPLSGFGDGAESRGGLSGTPRGTAGNDVFTAVTLGSGELLTNYDFGELAGAIAGTVYVDKNNNGAAESGEPGIAGVTVTLAGTITATGQNVCTWLAALTPAQSCTQTTDAAGAYAFGNLPAGSYSLTEAQPSAYADGRETAATAGSVVNLSAFDSTPAANTISGIALAAGARSEPNLFGERGLALSGRVYKDPQRDGVDSGEPGIAGVTIRLMQGATVVATAVTAPDGGFSFPDLPAGSYSVVEVQPAGYGSSTPDSFAITAVAGGNQFVAFGDTVGSLAGSVFVDGSDDGVRQTPGEAGIGGVTITLTGTDAGGLAVSRTAVTAADGTWRFADVLGGTYTLHETQPPAYSDGKDSAGSAGGTVSNDTIAAIALAPATDATAYAFGERGQGLTGTVYDDRNASGRNDGADTAISGVVLQLQRPDGTIVASATTDAAGHYSFPDIAAGDYVLVEVQPLGFGNAAEHADNRVPFTVIADTVIPSFDFGERTGSLAGLVYSDSNGDGQRQTSEPVIPGTRVTLSGTTARGEDVCSYLGALTPAGSCSVTTDAHGAYRFGGLPGGTYRIAETQPAGYDDGADSLGSAGGTLGADLFDAVALPAGTDATGYLFGERGAAGQISGTVWFDKDHDRVRDSDEPVKPNWTVQLLLGNTLIATTTTDARGAYGFAGLTPGSGYSLRFIAPEGTVIGGARTNEDASAANPGLASIIDGEITNLTLVPGTAVPQQSLPLDPSGVVYDSVRRVVVEGASVAISGPAGFDPAVHLLGGAANAVQRTGADGFYQFLLVPSAPAGVYRLTVTPPNGSYNPNQPSTILPPCAGPLVVGAAPDPFLVSLVNGAPADAVARDCALHSASTVYHLAFALTPGVSAPVLNNNIPIDPVLKGAIVVTKVTPKTNVSRGELVPYTITARNTLTGALTGMAIVDNMPAGFQYRAGSARIDGVAAEPVVTGRTLAWPGLGFAPQGQKTVSLLLVVGAGVGEGEHTNQAWAVNSAVGAVVSDVAEATVRIVPDPDFDCTDILGKVFDDRNANGQQDEGEPGLPGVRLATVSGLLITTDQFGRYHVTCPMIPNEARGSNFILKLDTRTLPTGYRLTTGNPETVRLTRGKFATLNFGASLQRVVRVDVSGAVFRGDSVDEGYRPQVRQLLTVLAQGPSVLRLAYHRTDETEVRARARIAALTALIRQCWHEDGDRYRLVIEPEIAPPEITTPVARTTGEAK